MATTALRSATTSAGTPASSASTADSAKSFRDADFMKIMLAEISAQDPFKPQDTSQIVTNVQKLQELANTRYAKFRDDMRWAQDLVGKDVVVQQQSISDKDAQQLRDKGLDPGIGYGDVTGSVETYRVIDEQVWVRVDGKDYPMDNVHSVTPPHAGADALADAASHMLGRRVTWSDGQGGSGEGLVSAVGIANGAVALTVGGKQVPMSQVTRIAQ